MSQETVEETLLRVLRKIVEIKGPGYYPLRNIVDLLQCELGEAWINPISVGRLMSRVGFTEKRKVGPGIQYRLTRDRLRNIEPAAHNGSDNLGG